MNRISVKDENRTSLNPSRGYLDRNSLGIKVDSRLMRYPDSGPLNIRSHKRYLRLAKEFFDLHFGKMNNTEVVTCSDFKLTHLLGEGAYGTVALAEHISSKTRYAIKFMKKEKLVQIGKVEQALSERKILQGLNCPFTIYLVNFYKGNQHIYFVLPYVQGDQLFNIILMFGSLTESQARFYISQVVLGLEYLHHLNLIHRDIKPQNILVDHTGYVKLVDFTFSKVLTRSRTYTLCGTPEYLAPEVILNKGHGTSVDWWAMGVTLYELLTGRTPFYNKDIMQVFNSIVTGSYRVKGTLSKTVADLLNHLLEVDLTRRYGNLKGGVNDIKMHGWFKQTNWMALLNRKVTPGFIPAEKLAGEFKASDEHEARNSITRDVFASYFKDFDVK